MDEFVKTIKLIIDDSQLTKVKIDVEKMTDNFRDLEGVFTSDEIQSFTNTLEEQAIQSEKLKKLQQTIVTLEKVGTKEALAKADALKLQFKQLEQTKDTTVSIKEALADAFSTDGVLGSQITKFGRTIANTVKSFLKDTISDALDELSNMASYSLSTSLFQSSSARSQALQYGLSNAENYALSKSMEQLGLQNEEDLFWMNDVQKEKFAEYIGKYSAKYEALEQKGFFQDFEEYQLEMKEFKEDMQLEVMTFFVDNKDAIKTAMTTGIQLLKGVLDVTIGILNFLSLPQERTEYERAQATSDIIQHYSTVNNTGNTNNVNQTNNWYVEGNPNQQQLVNVGNMTYQQIIKALS